MMQFSHPDSVTFLGYGILVAFLLLTLLFASRNQGFQPIVVNVYPQPFKELTEEQFEKPRTQKNSESDKPENFQGRHGQNDHNAKNRTKIVEKGLKITLFSRIVIIPKINIFQSVMKSAIRRGQKYRTKNGANFWPNITRGRQRLVQTQTLTSRDLQGRGQFCRKWRRHFIGIRHVP